MTRLLQRDVEELQGQPAPAAERICASFVPAQANGPPQRLDAEDPIITNVAGPCLQGWAGGYFWYVSYHGLVAFAGWREYRAGDAVTDSRPRPSFAPGP